MSKRFLVAVLLFASWVSFGAAAEVLIDGVENCTEYPALLDNWVEVSLGAGTVTVTLTESDFHPCTGRLAPMAVVMLDQVSTIDGHWLFTLHGPGDSETVTMGAGGRAFVGFVDTFSEDNTGGSTLDFGNGIEISIDGQDNCAEIPHLTDNWVLVDSSAGWDACYLNQSDFGASPGASNPMALVLCLNPLDVSFRFLFSIHSNSWTNFGYHEMLYTGFLDIDVSDNHGASIISFEWISPVEQSSWSEVKSLY